MSAVETLLSLLSFGGCSPGVFPDAWLTRLLYDPLLFTSDSSVPAFCWPRKSPSPRGLPPEVPVRLGRFQPRVAPRTRFRVHLPCPPPMSPPQSLEAGCPRAEEGVQALWEPGQPVHWMSAAQLTSAVSCSRCKAIPSQLQALSIPGPATMLYCLFPSAGRCKCSTCGCPELLALGIRDERPVTPRFMGRVWEASMLGRFCILQAIFLCLIPHSCHPPPRSFLLSPRFPCERWLVCCVT